MTSEPNLAKTKNEQHVCTRTFINTFYTGLITGIYIAIYTWSTLSIKEYNMVIHWNIQMRNDWREQVQM